MKEIVKTSRLAGQLEKLFRALNEDWFAGQLDVPVITIQSTPRAYGHYSVAPIWSVKVEEMKHEINIGAGTLDRPIENVTATLMHEMCHFYDATVLHEQDTSNRGVYHNKVFKASAEAHGLIVTRSEKYGWSHTEPADALIEWLLDNDIPEIRMNRNEGCGLRIGGTGGNAANGGAFTAGKATRPSSRRYHCPDCGTIIRATREVRVICADCMELMVEG